MVNRIMALFGLAAVVVALAASALVGAAAAGAEPGSTPGHSGAESSESKEPKEPKEPKESTDTAATESTRKPATRHPGGTHLNRPPRDRYRTGSADPQHSASSTGHESDDEQDPVVSPPASAPADTTGSADADRDLAPRRTKNRGGERNSDKPAPSDSTAAAQPDQPETPSPQAAPTAAPRDVPPEPEPEPEPASPITKDWPAEVRAVTQTKVAVPASASAVTAGLDAQVPSPRPAGLFDAVGYMVLNLVMGLIHAVDGPPVLPPNSNVIVRTSTLTIPVAGGRTVEADWYFPTEGDPPTRLIYLQHGLLASGPMYSYTAAALAEQTHSIVVVPSISSNWFDPDAAWLGGTPMQVAVAELFSGDRAALTESASAAAGHAVTLPTRFVLAGHSLGGSLVMGAAGYMVDNGAIDDLAGVLLLDSVDVNNTVPKALQKLTGVNDRPVFDISSERYVWNMDGRVGDELEAARPGRFNGVMLLGGRHIDALQGGNPLIQTGEYLLAGFSQPQNIAAVKVLATGWVNDMFAGTHDGVYGAPGATIPVHTDAGTATAVTLPFTSEQSVVVTPLDGLLRVVLTFLSDNVFVYEPLAGHETTTPVPVAV